MLSIVKNKTSTKKSASVYIGGCRITSSTTAASGNIYSYQYFLTDHLGSTRMVLDEDEQIVEATMYQPYGTMLPVEGIGTTSAMPVREKFTTKEFDEDGAARGQLEIDFTFDPSVNLTHTSGDSLKTNRIGIYFEDEPYEPVFAIYDQASEKWEIKGKFSYTTNRVIDRIHFMLNDDAINCMVYDIAVEVNQGTIVQISKHDITLSDLTPALPKTFFTYKTVGGFYMAGIGGYHFGRRYYDPELGVWGAVDPAGQFVNAYGYAGNGTNPIIFVDENGEWIGFAIGATIGGVAGLAWGYQKTGNWGQAFLISLGTSLAGGLIGHGIEKAIVAGMEHARPTGNAYLDDKGLRQQMKGGLEQFKTSGNTQEWGGAIDKAGQGKPTLRPGESVAPSSGAKASVSIPEPTNQTVATVHTQEGVTLGDNYLDLNRNFPRYDVAAKSAGAGQPNHIILSQDKIVSFTGDYTMRSGTYGSWSTDLVFKNYWQRFGAHLFTW